MGTSSLKPWGDTREKVPPANQVPKTAAAHPRYLQGTGAARQLLGWAKPPLALTMATGGLRQPPSRAPASTKFSSGPSWPWSILSMLWQLPHPSHRLAGSTACSSSLLARGAPAPGLMPQPRIPVTNAPQELSPPPLLEPGEIFIKSTSSLYRFCSLCKQQSLFLSPAVLKSSGLPLNNDLR